MNTIGTGERQARRIVALLTDRGVLTSDSSRAPLRLAFPAAPASRWMPGLFPEKSSGPTRDARVRRLVGEHQTNRIKQSVRWMVMSLPRCPYCREPFAPSRYRPDRQPTVPSGQHCGLPGWNCPDYAGIESTGNHLCRLLRSALEQSQSESAGLFAARDGGGSQQCRVGSTGQRASRQFRPPQMHDSHYYDDIHY